MTRTVGFTSYSAWRISAGKEFIQMSLIDGALGQWVVGRGCIVVLRLRGFESEEGRVRKKVRTWNENFGA